LIPSYLGILLNHYSRKRKENEHLKITFEVSITDTALIDYAKYMAETNNPEDIPEDVADYIIAHLVDQSNLNKDYLSSFTYVNGTKIKGMKAWVRKAIQALAGR
jgi:hypothetical protein